MGYAYKAIKDAKKKAREIKANQKFKQIEIRSISEEANYFKFGNPENLIAEVYDFNLKGRKLKFIVSVEYLVE